MKPMEFHEAANIFPLDEENIDELAADIKSQGQQVPIETLDGKIVDGRRRYLACNKAGITPQFRAVNVQDPVAYVLSLNLHRRHLTPTQLAMVGAKARDWYDRKANERQRSHGGTSPGKKKTLVENLPPVIPETGKARDQAGKAVGVSGKLIDAATKVLNNGTPALIEAVEQDKIAVSTAARASSLSEAEQDGIADRAKKGERKPRPSEDNDAAEEPETDRQEKGKGVYLAHEAINCLTRIPKNDALRKRGFQIVTDWIKHNK